MANIHGTTEFIHGKLGAIAPPYALVGFQYADSFQQETAGKRHTQGPPMAILSSDPGVTMIEDETWQLTYGASHDAFLAIINGSFIEADAGGITVAGIYREGTVNTVKDNLWRPAGEYPQIQFIATGETADEGSTAAKTDNADVSVLRGIGLRLPAMAAGYGRTVDGLPTDPLSTQPGGRANDEEHKNDRATWKYGPVEMRWDYRRGVWSAYNELITDHYNQQLGTWVFGTNPDFNGGFPFLRGKLEDVFWVRQPEEDKNTNGRQAGVITGEVFTHLKHRWYDEDEDGIGALDSIFIIPHAKSTDGDCHPKGPEHTLGPETTGDSDRIDIKTEAHFFKSKGIDGPIAFGGSVSSESVCCEPLSKKYHVGKMLFQDALPKICGPGGEEFIVAGDPSCEWVPAIAIDECELVGGHINDLIFNDVELGALNASLCAVVALYTQVLRTILNGNFTGVAIDFDDLQDEIEKVLTVIVNCLNNEIMSVWTSLDVFRLEVRDAFSELVDDINAALAKCCPGVELDFVASVNLPSVGIHDHPDPCKFNFEKISTFYDDFPEIPCDSCPPINLWTPCVPTSSVTITGGCNPIVPAVPQISDECQANSKKTNANTNNNGETGRLKEDGAGPRHASTPEPQFFFAGAGFIGVTPV